MPAAAAAQASAYWRAAGMSYLKYANMCAGLVRGAVKEPLREGMKAREAVYYRSSKWKGGTQAEQVMGNRPETPPGMPVDLRCMTTDGNARETGRRLNAQEGMPRKCLGDASEMPGTMLHGPRTMDRGPRSTVHGPWAVAGGGVSDGAACVRRAGRRGSRTWPWRGSC